MYRPQRLHPQFYTAHETSRMLALEGTPLASFRARGIAILIDLIFVGVLLGASFFAYEYLEDPASFKDHPHSFHFGTFKNTSGNPVQISSTTNGKENENGFWHYFSEFGIPVLYWGVITWATNGRTLGKWIAGVRVISTSHERIGFWQSVERALGYSVSMLEAGYGFVQYFFAPNRRTAHDRLAETIVIKDRNRRLGKIESKHAHKSKVVNSTAHASKLEPITDDTAS